ncbi:MAG: hypothetical protein IIB06_07595 [Bacteroidetes bacterium]|nr:hypothetical protein [Bacteroidota bacterium]
MKKILLFFVFLFLNQVNAQEIPIEIIDEKISNRIRIYAINRNEKDYDVMITIKGSNFRQSKSKPRLIRVPATSKVHLKDLIVTRGEQAVYTYDLIVNDSLSRRAIKKEYKLIKIKPKKLITIYITDNCTNCNSFIDSLAQSRYLFSVLTLNEKPKAREALQKAFENKNIPLDSIHNAIVSLGGHLYINIENYQQLLEKLNTEE